MFSLKEMCCRRILDEMVRHIHSNEGYVAMLVDNTTLRVLSSCCRVYDVLEEGVTVVEKIEKQRQPLPQLDALYFIAPDPLSVELLIKDFADVKRPHYRNVHVFFSSPIAPETRILDQISQDPRLFPRIKTFVEFNLNFIAYEQRVFHLDSPKLAWAIEPEHQSRVLHEICDKLLCVCASLGERPFIRYLATTPTSNACEQLANLLNGKLQRLSQKVTSHRKRCTMVIVDRSIDSAAPLLHEFTYQSMAYDVLDISVCESREATMPHKDGEEAHQDDTFRYEFTSTAGAKEAKTAVLGEQDQLWVRFRHQHISSVNDTVTEEVQNFARANAAARIQKGDKMTTEDTAQAIRQLPHYQDMLSKYWIHCTMSEKCFSELERRSLMKIGSLEQDLSTGIDKDGNTVSASKLLSTMGTFLSDPSIGSEEKLRLLMLYFTMMDGIKSDDRKKMMEAARLDDQQQRAVLNLLKGGVHQAQDPQASKSVSSSKHRHRTDKERLKFFKQRARNVNFELSRFEPCVKDIMEKAALDQLDRGLYPFVEDPAKSGQSAKVTGVRGSPTSRGPQWDWGQDSKLGDAGKDRGRLLVFIIGGMSFSEMRCAYEVSDSLQIDVVIGSTSILTPRGLLNQMASRGNAFEL